MKQVNKYRFLFAGGGTGGHLFPAVAVAEQIKKMKPEARILFVGTKSKIEGSVIPKLGYDFKSIWIKGFARKFSFENILFPLKLIISVLQSIYICIKFKPQVAIGSGGYVSGPAIFGASVMGAKIILLEQNSYPGITTRLLERYADEIHISFEDSKKYLKQYNKIFLSGNPVRSSLTLMDKSKACSEFSLDAEKRTILVLGGSLGAAAINTTVEEIISALIKINVQIIWMTGRLYFNKYKKYESDMLKVFPFIEKMQEAYSSADLVIARAGATTLAELTMLGKPSILIPSPNVAANHQYFNAKSLVDAGAALLLNDDEVKIKLFDLIENILFNKEMLNSMSQNALSISKPDAAESIAKRAIKLLPIV